MKIVNWLRGPAAVLVVLGIALGTVTVLSGCGSDAKKPGTKDTKAKKDTPKTKVETKPAPETKPEPQEAPGPKIEPEPKEEPKEKPKEAPAPETKPEMKPEPKEAPAPETKAEEKKPAPAPEDGAKADAKVSSYAPAENLAAQIDEYLEDFAEIVASEDEFEDSKDNLAKYGNTLIVIALALGKHDEDNRYQKAAPAMIKAAQALSAAEDLAAAKAAYDELKKAAASEGDASALKWEKVASMEQLMKAVPLISNKIRESSLKPSRLERKADDYARYAAVLAAIAQGSMPNADETEEPTEVEKWHNYCLQMRSAAGELNAAIRAKDSEAAVAALGKLNQSCDDCHSVFHKEETSE